MPFREVIGHRKLVALLARSVERASVPPSLIFAGPAGVGKRLVAVATAQALNCLAPKRTKTSEGQLDEIIQYDACGTCRACTRIARGMHPDVLLIEPGDTGSIKVDAVRDLIERAGYRPFEGRRRVVIINDADALVPHAQNALLKTLEEPPSASNFILVSAHPDALLPTVQSRCPRLRFRHLGPEDVATALMKRGKSVTEARAIAATADGSIGAALEASADDQIEARDAGLRVLAELAATDDPRRRVDSAKELLTNTGGGGASDREQLAIHLRAMASLLRDVELIAARADRQTLANPDVESALGRLTAFQGERGIRAFDAIDRALVALKQNAGIKIVADWVAMQI
jgi:DNA polymerase-3 subunit delta'